MGSIENNEKFAKFLVREVLSDRFRITQELPVPRIPVPYTTVTSDRKLCVNADENATIR